MAAANPPSLPLDHEIALFRRFNRAYTKFIGSLNEGLLNSGFSLAEARILYELANRSAPSASGIAEELNLDTGYLSRLLAKFERDGLLERKTSATDGRFAELALTPAGRSAFETLNALSQEQARTVLEDLPLPARMEVVRSMRAIEDILMPPPRTPRPYILRPHRVGDMGWVVYSEGLGYAEQYGWDETFEALAAGIVRDFVANFDAARERCWIAEIDGRHVGHVFLVKDSDRANTARLRLLYVDPAARGLGLGAALVNECVRFARTAGYRRMVLWTQSILTAAHRIYQGQGFRLTKETPHHSFGHDLVAQEWELEF